MPPEGEQEQVDTSLVGSASVDTSLVGSASVEPPAGEAPAGEAPAGEAPAGEALAGEAPAGEAPAGEAPEGEAPEGAPEEYADFTPPEGVELDADTLGAFKGLAKDFNLNQESAQKLVDLAAGLVQKQSEAFQAQIVEETANWRQSSVVDPEFGGAKLNESLGLAAKARDAYASPALRDFLDQSKLGDHPEIVRLFVKIGKDISEDTLVRQGKPTQRASFYDHPTSQRRA